MKEKNQLEETHGEVLELITPCGFKVTLRQQTGDDDDILSSSADALDGTSMNKFIASIIIDTDFTEKGKVTLSDILNMKLCDKYFILIASRIFSIGQILKFEYQWEGLKDPTPYEEDLSAYIWEYEKNDFPSDKSDSAYFKYRIKPHPAGKETHKELTLSSGKILRYSYMNGRGEKYLMSLPLEEGSKNKELIARDLHQKIGEQWIKVQNFKAFTTTDMREIRNDVFNINDPILELATDLEHPKTKEIIQYPLVGSTDFFYPREV